MSELSIWQVLALEPTNDVRQIKRAYAKALKQCRPEDDAERFQRLRWAYEWALHHANQVPTPVQENAATAPILSPVQEPDETATLSRERHITARYAKAAQHEQQWRQQRAEQQALAQRFAAEVVQSTAYSPVTLAERLEQDIHTLGASFESREMYELALLRALAAMSDLPWPALEPIAHKFSWFDADVRRQLLRADREAATAVLRPMLAEYQWRQWLDWLKDDYLGREVLKQLNQPELSMRDKAWRLRFDFRQRLQDLLHLIGEESPELWWRLQQNSSTQWWLQVLQKAYNNPINRFKRWCAQSDVNPINWIEWGVSAFIATLLAFSVRSLWHLSGAQMMLTGAGVFVFCAAVCIALNLVDGRLRGKSFDPLRQIALLFAIAVGLLSCAYLFPMTQAWLLVPAWIFYFLAASATGNWPNHGQLLRYAWLPQVLIFIWTLALTTGLPAEVLYATADDSVSVTTQPMLWLLLPILLGLQWLSVAFNQVLEARFQGKRFIWLSWFVIAALSVVGAALWPHFANQVFAPMLMLLAMFAWANQERSNENSLMYVPLFFVAYIAAMMISAMLNHLPSFSRFLVVTTILLGTMRAIYLGLQWHFSRRHVQA